MCGEEHKTCSRCHAPFVCRAGSIQRCQCNTVVLNDMERAYIKEQFSDCLCARCLNEMKAEYIRSRPSLEL